MRQGLIFVVIGLLSGVALATFIGRQSLPPPSVDLGAAPIARNAPASAERALAERVAELEAALAGEAERHSRLAAEVLQLRERLASLAEADSGNAVTDADTIQGAGGGPGSGAVRIVGSARFGARQSPDFKINQLIEAGFSPDEAQSLVERESQLRLDMMNESYEARREGGQLVPQVDVMQRQREFQAQLRSDLGDEPYERYLRATGQPTGVNITEVLSNSAGAVAGLQPGDEIVGYNGERVFNLLDLRAQTIDGEPGETVPVDILRDGQPMQIYIQRGPLGITGGGFFRGGPGGNVFIR